MFLAGAPDAPYPFSSPGTPGGGALGNGGAKTECGEMGGFSRGPDLPVCIRKYDLSNY